MSLSGNRYRAERERRCAVTNAGFRGERPGMGAV